MICDDNICIHDVDILVILKLNFAKHILKMSFMIIMCSLSSWVLGLLLYGLKHHRPFNLRVGGFVTKSHEQGPYNTRVA